MAISAEIITYLMACEGSNYHQGGCAAATLPVASCAGCVTDPRLTGSHPHTDGELITHLQGHRDLTLPKIWKFSINPASLVFNRSTDCAGYEHMYAKVDLVPEDQDFPARTCHVSLCYHLHIPTWVDFWKTKIKCQTYLSARTVTFTFTPYGVCNWKLEERCEAYTLFRILQDILTESHIARDPLLTQLASR